MKKIILLAASLVLTSQHVSATSYDVVADDLSQESQLCVKAATGAMTLNDIAQSVGETVSTLDRRVQCNGMEISAFVSQFNKVELKSSHTLSAGEVVLNAGNANKDAKLCVIAASGDINKLKRETRLQGLSVKSFVKYNRCNDQSVSDFVDSFGDQNAAAKLAKFI